MTRDQIVLAVWYFFTGYGIAAFFVTINLLVERYVG